MFGRVVKFLTRFKDSGAPVVSQRLLFLGFRKRFCAVEEQIGISLAFLHQIQPDPSKADVKGIGVKLHHGAQIFLCLIAVAEFYI
jgi:hypothetical protein